jgi:hypothetical protein
MAISVCDQDGELVGHDIYLFSRFAMNKSNGYAKTNEDRELG